MIPTMPVYVPSCGRADRSLTLEALQGAGWPVALVVPKGEAKAYKRLGLAHGVPVIPHPCPGIAELRGWIGQHCKTDRFLMMDDDLRFYYRDMMKPKEPRLWKFESGDMRKMLIFTQAMLSKFAHVSISAREGNNRLELPYVRCSRPLRVLGYRKEPFIKLEHGRVQFMEDFDVTLQLMYQGYQNAVITAYAQDQPQTQAPGGCSTYRTHEAHERAVARMSKIHKGFAQTRVKENKTGGEFGTRLELTIYWQRAWEHGMRDIL